MLDLHMVIFDLHMVVSDRTKKIKYFFEVEKTIFTGKNYSITLFNLRNF